ncbi:MAG: tetratricopeptide repeat protein, partial [Planctomycetota bacterium]|nr:tetratricopeptide repeat protein [Planctomycetota bacterium]
QECEQACPGDEFVAAELAEAFSDRGYFSLQNSEPAAAQKDFESALQFSPVPEARLGLAQFAVVAGDFSQAEELGQKILEDHPDFFPARELLAKIRITLGDSAGAEAQYRAIVEEMAVPRVYLSLAALLEKQERGEEAREVLFQGLTSVPDDSDLVLAASRYAEPEERWKLLNQALSVAPRSFELWFERACAACAGNDPEEAAISLNHCLEIDPERLRSAWKAELAREGSSTTTLADHPYLVDFRED